MAGRQDWSQFVPNLIVGVIVGLILVIIAAAIAYLRSERFHGWVQPLLNRLRVWLHAHGQVVVGVIVFLTIACTTYALTQALDLGLTQSRLSVLLALFLTLTNFLPVVWHGYPSERRQATGETQKIKVARRDLLGELAHFHQSKSIDVEESAGRDIIQARKDLLIKYYAWEVAVGRLLIPDDKERAKRSRQIIERARDVKNFQYEALQLSDEIISLSHIALDRVE